MNKFALIAALSALVTGAAFAQAPKTPAKAKTIKCAVMPNDDVDIAKATKDKMFADYKGRRYFFCCAGCPDAFKKAPAKYAKNASIPTPKKKA
ncbi:MAG: YHS domain-containing protein [Fimbriimonas sp.]